MGSSSSKAKQLLYLNCTAITDEEWQKLFDLEYEFQKYNDLFWGMDSHVKTHYLTKLLDKRWQAKNALLDYMEVLEQKAKDHQKAVSIWY
jgi:hypothetical protein